MTTEQPFENKIALITGSGRGIGRAIACHLAARGAHIVVNYFRNRGPAEQTAEEVRALGRDALLVKANVGQIEQIEAMFDQIEAHFGALDIFISNAASGYNRPITEQRPKGWDWTMNINARAFLFAAQKAVPLMQARGGGYIVSLTSPGSQHVLPDYAVVGASKAAIEALTRYMAVEFSPQNIVVNAVSPSVVATDALQYFEVTRGENITEKLAQDNPAGRLVTVEDVAHLVAFLCTPAASMIRGQVITIDGGHSLLVKDSLSLTAE